MSQETESDPAVQRLPPRPLSQALVVTGIVIAVANMVLAWVMMFTRPTDVTDAIADPRAAAVEGKAAQLDPSMAATMAWLGPSLRSDQRRELVNTNILTLTVAFSFALMAIGFSLFVMGIEGALSFHTELDQVGRLVLKTASPGILCIVLSTLTLIVLLWFTQTTFGDTAEAAKAETIRAEAEARVRLLQAEADVKEKEGEANAARAQRELEAQTTRFEQQLELERARAQPSAPALPKAR
ncbi:MAG TPA: hypothetical protein PLO41_14505 [Rubrivivax sp.]|nr:hypothetical protein [Rubrivivax sp.]